MKTRVGLAALCATVVFCFFCLLCATPIAAPRSPREDALEQKIVAELRERDPKAADLFVQGTADAERNDLEAAAARLEQVRAAAPWFVHATTRLCWVEARRRNRDRAISLCRQAFAADRSPVNETALAFSLLKTDGPSPPEDTLEALRLARDASSREEYPTASTQMVLCQSALEAGDMETLPVCADRLRRIAPDQAGTYYFATIADASRHRSSDAAQELEIARARGLPDDAYRTLKRLVDDSRPSFFERWAGEALRFVVGWLSGFGFLLCLGALLSAATLRAVSRAPAEASGHARGRDAMLRQAYCVVLWMTCGYYYVSLPIVALLVLGLVAGALYACLALGQIPIRLLFLGAVIVFGSLWAMAKSLFVRVRDKDPGERLDLGEHARLRAVLDEVAARIGTRPVDSVYMTPGAEIAVFERGGVLKQVRGQSTRCLVLGAAVLEGMRVREFKAILAHEYGHFQNADTAGGGLALAVRRSLMTMALHLAQARVASVINPAWWFVRGFYAVFLRVSHGASRLQEVLADRWAAFAYGSDTFVRGLTHVIDRSVRFDAHVAATLGEVVSNKEPLANVYAYVPKEPVAAEKIDEEVSKAMNRPAAPFDSHPPPVDRIAWVAKLAAPAPEEAEGDCDDAWSLLAIREVIEKRMTATVRAQLATQGIRIAAPARA